MVINDVLWHRLP